ALQILRVRDNGANARIEVGKDEMWKLDDPETWSKTKKKLLDLGYESVTLDRKGYRPVTPNRN
ncbi:MAG: hypothetical protein ACW99Q_17585, partial [Candidatus Kariarchaeaceae archaeon]